MNSVKTCIICFILLLAPATVFSGQTVPVTDLTVRFDLVSNTIRGVTRITLAGGQNRTLDLSGLKIISASINGNVIIVEPGIASYDFEAKEGAAMIEIHYEAEFPPLSGIDAMSNPGVVRDNLISSDGISLTTRWHPSVSGLSLYNLTAVLPTEFEGISEADVITIKEKTDITREFTFLFSHPVDGITFIAGPYKIAKESLNGTDIYTYILPGDEGLSSSYIEYTKKYLDLYERLLGAFPFRRFSVVENIFPTGYSFPTFTLLGRDVVRLPFIVETSLGHEILHQWFGNFVYTDYEQGNWAEGLTTYLADHLYEELKESGWDYRKQAIISYESYVNKENDFPLRSFTSRTDRISSSIGYGKAAMVFHMLRTLVGEETFFNSLKLFIEKNKFRPASWNDVSYAFEASSGIDLAWFFDQWVTGMGIPELTVDNLMMSYRGSKAVVSFDVQQKGTVYTISLPVLIRLQDGVVTQTVNVSTESTPVEIEVEGTPLEVVIDENYDIFRKLSGPEMPPVLSRLLGNPKRVFVLPQGREEEYVFIGEFFRGLGFTKIREEELTYETLKSSSLIIPGLETDAAKKLFGKQRVPEEDFFLTIKENPMNKGGVIALLDGASPEKIYSYLPKITHYGKYSSLTFSEGKNTGKAVSASERGMRKSLADLTIGVELPRTVGISDVVEKVRGKKIIYVGESHDQFGHHRAQFEIIRALHQRNRNIAIGMEMFQKPFQKALDDYIGSSIDEKTFLKKSEYFRRWGFDYNLYREILLYARANKIPVIALNIDRDIVSRVSRDGLQALTEEERKSLPHYIDLSDESYRKRLQEFFEAHKSSVERNFDFFYQAQILWDESMAHNLDEFLRNNPDRQVVVIAGVGHMEFGSGIPQRTFRLNGKDYSIILNGVPLERTVGDFVLYPGDIRAPESPKLMVILNEAEKTGVRVAGFPPNSISQKAGLKEGDVILSLDDTPVETVEDIKISLLYKKSGDTIRLKVYRKRFLFGPYEKEIEIKL